MKTEAQVNILGACSFSRLPRMSRGETYRLRRHKKLQVWPYGTISRHGGLFETLILLKLLT